MLKKYILFSLGMALFFASCDEVVYDPVVSVGGSITLSSTAAGSTVVLTDSTLESTFAIFDWTKAEFGFQAAVTYTLQVDTTGNNFADPTSLGNTSDLTLESVVEERMNSIALSRGTVSGDTASFDFRVMATINDDVESVLSNVITIHVVPFESMTGPMIPVLNVPGSYQGWDPAAGNTVIYSREMDEIYDGYLYFAEDAVEFKYAKGSWDADSNWGDTDADGTLELEGANIVAGTAGMYYLTADLNALTHTFEQRNWGIIGTATPGGWDSDTDMTWDEEKSALTITMDMTAGGEYKFRANDDWAVNFGDNDADGSLEQDGANIVVEEDGNYTIDLILNEAVYTYSVKKN